MAASDHLQDDIDWLSAWADGSYEAQQLSYLMMKATLANTAPAPNPVARLNAALHRHGYVRPGDTEIEIKDEAGLLSNAA